MDKWLRRRSPGNRFRACSITRRSLAADRAQGAAAEGGAEAGVRAVVCAVFVFILRFGESPRF